MLLDIERFRSQHDWELFWMMVFGFGLSLKIVPWPNQRDISFWGTVAELFLALMVGLALSVLISLTYRRRFKGGVPESETSERISPTNYSVVGVQLFKKFAKAYAGGIIASAMAWVIYFGVSFLRS